MQAKRAFQNPKQVWFQILMNEGKHHNISGTVSHLLPFPSCPIALPNFYFQK